MGSIRAGLAFQIKSAVGQSVIAAAEESLGTHIYGSLTQNPNIAVLGLPTTDANPPARLPIISFLIRGPAAGAYTRPLLSST